MKIKEKKCKGTGKAIGYGCGELVLERVYGLGKSCKCYSKWLLGSDIGLEILEKSKIKAKKIVVKTNKLEDKKFKDENTDWREKLQSKVQEISRLIDFGQPCLARNYHPSQMHGGHVFSKGSNKTMALNIHNIHRQSAQSNHYQNEDGLLREGLINEYGKDYFEFLGSLRRIKKLKYFNYEYQEFYKVACSIANKLKKDKKKLSKIQRIEKRNEVNLKLGIYDKEYCIYELKNLKQ